MFVSCKELQLYIPLRVCKIPVLTAPIMISHKSHSYSTTSHQYPMKSPLNHHENNGYNPIHIPISYLFHPKSHSQNSILPHLYTILDFHHFIMVYPSPHPVTPLCLERDSPMGRQRGVSHFCVNRQGFGFANAEGPPLATAPATS